MRRYYDTKEANPHLINAGKYSTSFFVVVFSAVASTVIGGERFKRVWCCAVLM